jgi:shikimate kinase
MATGKSTVASELAKITSIPRVPMDRVRWYYYYKHGFSLEKELSIDSFTDVMKYWKPFEVNAVERIVEEFKDSIIDFGAGHSYFTDKEQFENVQNSLRDIPNVFLLLPSDDKEESLKISNERLESRKKDKLDETEISANRDFINHESNYKLAKHIIYTKGKTPIETANEIKSLLSCALAPN